MPTGASPGMRKLPVVSVETNIPGVHSFVPPPRGLDLATASQATLLKHGVFFRRPDAGLEPRRFALWERFVTEIWTEDNFVLPVFEQTSRPSHNLKGPVEYLAPNNAVARTWSGVAVRPKGPQSWVGAMGVWNVPELGVPAADRSDAQAFYSSTWVGLDGAWATNGIPASQDVLQAGVENVVIKDYGPGQITQYAAWYEWYTPAFDYEPYRQEYKYLAQVNILNMEVAAGDQMCVAIQYVQHKGDLIGNPNPPQLPTGGHYTFGAVLIVNVTRRQAMSFYLSPPPYYDPHPHHGPGREPPPHPVTQEPAPFTGDSAEWIMELTSEAAGDPVNVLPAFSALQFTDAGACDPLDAPPSGDIGVELENAVVFNVMDDKGVTETDASGTEDGVTIEAGPGWTL